MKTNALSITIAFAVKNPLKKLMKSRRAEVFPPSVYYTKKAPA